jgi:hypothetical protein
MSDLLPFLAPWSGRILTLAVFLSGLTACALFLRRGWRNRSATPACPACSYDLSATHTPLCPECGRSSTAPQRARGPRRTRAAIICFLVALSLPTFVAQRRMRQYGWDYYLRLRPLYDLFPMKTVRHSSLGRGFDLRVTQNRRSIEYNEYLTVRGPGAPAVRHSEFRVLPPLNPIEDLNADGYPDILIETHSGGAHCCSRTLIISLDPSGPRTIFDFYGGESSTLPLPGPAGAPRTLETNDDAFAYWKVGFAGSPMPRVLLAWNGTTWAFSQDLNRASAHSEEDLLAVAAAASADLSQGATTPSSDLWDAMLDLIYTGHADRAMALLDQAWPDTTPGKQEFRKEFLEQLDSSPFINDLRLLNGPQAAALTP